MTTIANCFNLSEAQHLKMVLEACGIPSFIPDETSAGVAPHHFLTESGVRLQASAEHEEEARRIVEQERQKPDG